MTVDCCGSMPAADALPETDCSVVTALVIGTSVGATPGASDTCSDVTTVACFAFQDFTATLTPRAMCSARLMCRFSALDRTMPVCGSTSHRITYGSDCSSAGGWKCNSV